MKVVKHFLETPNYFNMLVCSTGLLSGEERFNRIKDIAKRNIWLAARCKNSCVNDEEEVVNWLVLRCEALYAKFRTKTALAALMELGEYKIFCDLLKIGVGKNFFSFSSVSEAFATLSWLLPYDFSRELFDLLKELGYPMDVRAFNGLMAKVEDAEELDLLMKEMTEAGIEADGNSFLYRLRRSHGFYEALPYFKSFCESADYDNVPLCSEAYRLMFGFAEDMNFIQTIYDDLLTKPKGADYERVMDFYYSCCKMKFSSSPTVVTAIFEDFCTRTNHEVGVALERYKKALSDLDVGLVRARRENDKAKEQRIEKQKVELMNPNRKMRSKVALFRKSLNIMTKMIYRGPYVDITFVPFLSMILQRFTILFISPQNMDELLSTRLYVGDRIELWKEVIRVVSENHLPTPPQALLLLAKVKTNAEVDQLLSQIGSLNKYEPKELCAIMNEMEDDRASYFFDYLQRRKYPMNMFLYNVLIKKSSLSDSFMHLRAMLAEGFSPDIFSIQPLLRKWKTINELFKIAEFATARQIYADKQVTNAIVRRTRELGLADELIDTISAQRTFLEQRMNKSWVSVLYHAGNILNNAEAE